MKILQKPSLTNAIARSEDFSRELQKRGKEFYYFVHSTATAGRWEKRVTKREGLRPPGGTTMKIAFSVIEAAYSRHLTPTPFSARQIERYGLRSVAETALPDVGSLRTVLCDDEIDRLVAGLSPDEQVEIVD